MMSDPVWNVIVVGILSGGGGNNELSQPVSGCHTWSSIIVCRVGMRYQCVTRAVMELVDVMVV